MVSYIRNTISQGLTAARDFAGRRPVAAATAAGAALAALAYYAAPAIAECARQLPQTCTPQPPSCVTDSITPLLGSEALGNWYYGPPTTICTAQPDICTVPDASLCQTALASVREHGLGAILVSGTLYAANAIKNRIFEKPKSEPVPVPLAIPTSAGRFPVLQALHSSKDNESADHDEKEFYDHPKTATAKAAPLVHELDEKDEIFAYDPVIPAAEELPADWNPELGEIVCGDPTASDVFLLEDLHRSKTNLAGRKRCVEALVKEGDIVLFEGKQRFIALNPLFLKETKDLKCQIWAMGWDDLGCVIEANKYLKLCLDLAQEIEKTVPKFDFEAQPNHEVAHSAVKIYMRKMEQLDLIYRNESMLRTIKRLRELYPEKRIFVIAGGSHFNGMVHRQLAKIPFCQIRFPKKTSKGSAEKHVKSLITQVRAERFDYLISVQANDRYILPHPRHKVEDLNARP